MSRSWPALVALTLVALTPAGGLLPARATAPMLFYAGQSLIARPLGTAALADLWLGRDGRYDVFYDAAAPVAGRRFRFEGRQGAYRLLAAPDGVQLCLRPDPDTVARTATAGIALFHDEGCTILPVRPIGEAATIEVGGVRYGLMLLEGR